MVTGGRFCKHYTAERDILFAELFFGGSAEGFFKWLKTRSHLGPTPFSKKEKSRNPLFIRISGLSNRRALEDSNNTQILETL